MKDKTFFLVNFNGEVLSFRR